MQYFLIAIMLAITFFPTYSCADDSKTISFRTQLADNTKGIRQVEQQISALKKRLKKTNEKMALQDKEIEKLNNQRNEYLGIINRSLPVGTIISSVLPPNDLDAFYWLPLDKSPIPTDSKYHKLTGRAQTFDFRGLFVRGLNAFRQGIRRTDKYSDPDGPRSAGGSQMDTLKSHKHGITINTSSVSPEINPSTPNVHASQNHDGRFPLETKSSGTHQETRPKNVAVFYYIKIN